MFRWIFFALFPVLSVVVSIASVANAQANFPERSIRLIVPLAPGGGGDIVARLLAAHLQPVLGQPIVVDNKPGGATVIGTNMLAKAQPDGYTLVMATSSHAINGSLIKLPFDPVKDFTGISLIATSPLVLTVNPQKTPVESLGALVEAMKSKPDGMAYASSGLGSLPHLSGALLAKVTGTKLMHVAYKGSAPAEAGLLGGQVDMYFGSPSSLMGQVQAGKLRMIATTGAKRSKALPDVPAMSETYPGFLSETFYAILAPAGTPALVVDRLNAAIKQVMQTPDMKSRLTDMGAEVANLSPSETMSYLDSQIRQWSALVKETGIKPE